MQNKIMELLTQEALLSIFKRYAVELADAKDLGGFENVLYEFSKGGRDSVLRITHSSHRKLSELNGELDFILHLKLNGLSVPEVYVSEYGNLVESIGDQQGGYFHVVCFSKLTGIPVIKESDLNYAHFVKIGRTLATMHEASSGFVFSSKESGRPNWNDDFFKNIVRCLSEDRSWVSEEYEHLESLVSKMGDFENEFGLIHFDLHQGNYLVEDELINVFDFDDCSFHLYIADIAIVLFYSVIYSKNLSAMSGMLIENFKGLVSGYREVRSLSVDSLRILPMLLRQRELLLFSILSERFDLGNPSGLTKKIRNFVKNFEEGHFGGESIFNIDFVDLERSATRN